ncbi:MAG TPA: helix-turn-helix transcriptional regulator [Acidimicrobiia bacterium]|nr:helix-turn-helix transcriptional regulator [Acidimicrobiia bacterium]
MSRTDFGAMLRDWRHARGLSQLELATRADVSQRHVSFLETGRSRPSREMVIHLGLALDVPPREQNLLLLAAAHAPEFTETPLDDLEHIAGVLDLILEAHEPNIAIVVDRGWNLVRANRAATRFTSILFPEPPSWAAPRLNVMRLNFHPEGMRRHMSNWEPTAAALLRRLERDVASHPHDPNLAELLTEVRGYPQVGMLPRRSPRPQAGDLLVPVTYSIHGEEVSLFTTIAIVGDAHDLTLAELRLETFWPADPTSAERWKRLIA